MADHQVTISEEVWKQIPEFTGYEVSNFGRIRSYWKSNGPYKNSIVDSAQRINQLSIERSGYLIVNLSKNGMKNVIRVHRLVLLAFIGPCPNGMEACHNDGNRRNNHLSNLRWDTRLNNIWDTIKHGHHRSRKLTNEQVANIIQLYESGMTQTEIAKRHCISQPYVSEIVRLKSRTHII